VKSERCGARSKPFFMRSLLIVFSPLVLICHSGQAKRDPESRKIIILDSRLRGNDSFIFIDIFIDFLRARYYFLRFSGRNSRTAAPAFHISESRISLSSFSNLTL
jgi:hypothetical protein